MGDWENWAPEIMDEKDLEGEFWRANGTKEAEAIKMIWETSKPFVVVYYLWTNLESSYVCVMLCKAWELRCIHMKAIAFALLCFYCVISFLITSLYIANETMQRSTKIQITKYIINFNLYYWSVCCGGGGGVHNMFVITVYNIISFLPCA